MFFRDIIGQDKIKERLIRSVKEERVSHAQLLSGPEGSGKLGLAIAYARYLSCRNRTDTDSCGTCPSCRKYTILQHPDLHFVFPIFKKKNVQKSYCDDFLPEWREMLLKSPYFTLNQWLNAIDTEKAQGIIYAHESESIIRKLNLKPYESGYKVMIIWLPERMHIVCANKLLKMVEEPPDKTLFLLVTEDEERIISTIRSRTQVIRVPKITSADMQQLLEKEGGFDPETIAEIVHRANGNYLKALEYSSPDEDKSYYFETFQKIMRLAFQSKVPELLDLAEELGAMGREPQKEFLLYAMQLVREYFMMNFGKPSLVYLTREEKEFGKNFARFVHERNVIPLNALFEEGYLHISMNGNGKIVFTDSLLKVVRLIRR